jgi:hypothetical protein
LLAAVWICTGLLTATSFSGQTEFTLTSNCSQIGTKLGSNNFAFEIMDELPARGGDVDYRAELDALENLWLEKLQPFGERGYNEPKLSRAELLRRMRQKSGSREHYE